MKVMYENNKNIYYRFTGFGRTSVDSPMSEWGHAMFSIDKTMINSGNYGYIEWNYIPDKDSIHIRDLFFLIKDKLQYELYENFYTEQGYIDWRNQIEHGDFTLDDLVHSFNPISIVDSAEAYDDPVGIGVIEEILSDIKKDAVILISGAIVFNENKIIKVNN